MGGCHECGDRVGGVLKRHPADEAGANAAPLRHLRSPASAVFLRALLRLRAICRLRLFPSQGHHKAKPQRVVPI